MGNLGEGCLRCKTPEVRDTAVSAVLPQGTKAVSCPAVRSGESWQELWWAAGVYRRAALMEVFIRSPKDRVSVPECCTLFTDTHGTLFFSGHTVGKNSVSYWKLSVTWKYQEYDWPTFHWLPKKSRYSLVTLGLRCGIHDLISGRCWDSIFTVPGTSEVMGMCCWHANVVLPSKPPKQKCQSSSSTLSSHRAEERPSKHFHPPT